MHTKREICIITSLFFPKIGFISMIITRLYVDNLYGFQDFELDLTYPRKHSQPLLDFEYLEDVPAFKFKRVCILMGTNASGKTSLGKILLGIQWMLNGDSIIVPSILYDAVCNIDESARIEIEFVFSKSNQFISLSLGFLKNGKIVTIEHTAITLNKSDSNITAKNRLENQKEQDKLSRDLFNPIDSESDKIAEYYQDKAFSFYYVFAENHNNEIRPIRLSTEYDFEILLKILKSFDCSIIDVAPLKTTRKDDEDIIEGYTVFFENGDSVKVTNNGETFTQRSKNRFSKGTYDVLSVADFILSVIKNDFYSSIYFLDEKLSSSHSELEITILNLIIQKLNRYSQFFYTTHNYDVLDLNLPSHSFVFLHKEYGYCMAEQPEKLGFSKNDRTLKGYVRNNYFKTIPSTQFLDELIWGE